MRGFDTAPLRSTHGGNPSNAAADLAFLCNHVRPRVEELLAIVDTPYGPRMWIPFGKCKRAARLVREIQSEVDLIASTSMLLKRTPDGKRVIAR